jgi:hypothetical protein
MKTIVPIVAAACLLAISSSCKKAIEKKKEEMVLAAMTEGVWIVEQYFEADSNISYKFLHYEFKFNRDGSLIGTNNATVANGTWVGNVSNYSITSEFPSATDPLKKLNGMWVIKDSYWNYVKAVMTTAGGTNTLHLIKKEE